MNIKKNIRNQTISVVIPTFNSTATIEKCLKSVRYQDYPQKNIEIILADGGSRDKTQQISKKFNVRWINIDPKKQNVEYNKSIGIQNAKNEILFMLDHDNILPNKRVIRDMVQPFLENKKIVGVETIRYHYNPKATLLDRYIALFGVIEPLAWYLGKADRMSYIKDGYDKKYDPKDCGKYYLVNFNKDNLPTVGANGFMIRRNILLKHASTTPEKYFPIDVNLDLVRKGFNAYAFVKNSIVHLSGHGDVMDYLKRRILFIKQYHLSENRISIRKSRRYALYEKKDFWKLVYFIVISLTFVIPFLDSFRGYLRIRDKAWFLNPFLCIAFVIIYGYLILTHQFKRYFK